MKLYGLKNCDSCKRARRDLSMTGIELEFIDIRQEPPSKEVLELWLAAVGEAVLVNRKSTTWRGLTDDERAMPALSLLAANPTLIKRPVIMLESDVHVGWTDQVRTALGCQ